MAVFPIDADRNSEQSVFYLRCLDVVWHLWDDVGTRQIYETEIHLYALLPSFHSDRGATKV